MRHIGIISIGVALVASGLVAQRSPKPLLPQEHIHVAAYTPLSDRSRRVVLVETESWVDCAPGCRLRDVTLDAVLHRYTRADVVVLTHHYNPPLLPADEGPGPDGYYLSRFRYYEISHRTHGRCFMIYVDGNCPSWGAEYNALPQVLYDSVTATIDRRLTYRADVQLRLETVLTAEGIETRLYIASVPSSRSFLKAHLLLVEDSVAFVGNNGIPVHRMVWRASAKYAVPGEGVTLVGGRDTVVIGRFDVAALRTELKRKNEAVQAKNGELGVGHQRAESFPAAVFALVSTRLAIVAFVQDDRTGEILQTVYQPVQPST